MRPRLRHEIGTLAIAAAMLAIGSSRAGTSPRLQQEPAPTFRATADVVSVEASVRKDRRAVIGLAASDFEILDNGIAQSVAEISYEKLPIDLTIVLDVSASVTGSVLDQLRRSVRQLRTDLGPRDRLRVLTFNMRIRELAGFDNAASPADTAIAAIHGYGSSAIFDSLAVALASAVPPGRRHLIVLFSDGQDSSSISDSDALLDVARRSTPTVAVVLASPSIHLPASVFAKSSALAGITVGTLYDRLAKDTGGVVVSTEIGDNLAPTFRRVLEDFRSTYVLYFTPRGVQRGGSHTLDVRVKRDGVEVHARRNYVWQ